MSDPRLQSIVNAGLARIQTAMRLAAMQCAEGLERALFSGTRSDTERFVWQQASSDLRRKLPAFNTLFNTTLKDRVQTELARAGESSGRSFADTDWRTLALVDDNVMDEQVAIDRLNREISSECEWELREYESFVRSLLAGEVEERQRNPLRPEHVARALVKAISGICDDPAGRKVLQREIGKPVAKQMKTCYGALLEDMQKRGIEPVQLAVKTVEGPGNELARDGVRDTGYQAMKRDPRTDVVAAQALGALFGMSVPADLVDTAPGGGAGMAGGGPGWSRSSGFGPGPGQGPAVGRGGATGPGGFPRLDLFGDESTQPGGGHVGGGGSGGTDVRMLDLIRRLATIATSQVAGPLGVGGGAGGGGALSGAQGGGAFRGTVGGALSGAAGAAGAARGSEAFESTPGTLSPNVIRAYRSELREAASGALDHMVIDIVAALFDQVLADPSVPPQMARQIARLQLPVLRAALKDVGFFRSRKHPVRRFVNRIASLAAAYEQFDDGPGRAMLEKVRTLVQQIVEGDFDQVELYEAKLAELEELVGHQSKDDQEAAHAKAAALLDGKENLLRLQQRYTLALKAPLAELSLPDFAADFLAQVWSQVVVYSAMRDGPDSASVRDARGTARELVMSLQPKGAPQQRKEFLVRLPHLMRELNEGLGLVRWPEEAKRAFFAKLLPAHASSLKEPPLQDFDLRMLNAKLDALDRLAVPGARDATQGPAAEPTEYEATPISALMDGGQTVPVPFTEEEKAEIGLVEEQQVDWDGQIDIDVDLIAGGDVVVTGQEVDLNLDTPPTPHAGVQLIHHMQPGSAYLMQVDSGGWKKVRLSWVSPGRGFFVFTQGRKEQRTLSMTARMLHRLCESGKFRAFEQAELIERATIRARRQLAKLGSGAGAASTH